MASRTTQQRIAELEAKIQSIKEREERKKARAKPEARFLGMALRSIDKALNATEDAVIKKPLDEARTTVASCLALCGIKPRAARRTLAARPRATRVASAPHKARAGKLDPDAVLTYVRNNSGQKGEEIAAEFGVETAELRPALKGLVVEGRVRTEGERRGTRYFVGA